MKPSLAKHDTLCSVVAHQLRARGWYATTNVEYKGRRNGEIDVLAYKDNYVLDVEVKCNLRYKNKRKAIDQLDRAYRFCPALKGRRAFTMIAHEKEGVLKYNFVPQTKTLDMYCAEQ